MAGDLSPLDAVSQSHRTIIGLFPTAWGLKLRFPSYWLPGGVVRMIPRKASGNLDESLL